MTEQLVTYTSSIKTHSRAFEPLWYGKEKLEKFCEEDFQTSS